MSQYDKALQDKGIVIDVTDDTTIVDNTIADIDGALDDDLDNPDLLIS